MEEMNVSTVLGKKKELQYFHGKNELWVGNVGDEELLQYIISNELSNDCAIKYNVIGDVAVATVADVKQALVRSLKNDTNDNKSKDEESGILE